MTRGQRRVLAVIVVALTVGVIAICLAHTAWTVAAYLCGVAVGCGLTHFIRDFWWEEVDG